MSFWSLPQSHARGKIMSTLRGHCIAWRSKHAHAWAHARAHAHAPTCMHDRMGTHTHTPSKDPHTHTIASIMPNYEGVFLQQEWGRVHGDGPPPGCHET
eukprot:2233186-Alexandrium_andersonii.AAC.1